MTSAATHTLTAVLQTGTPLTLAVLDGEITLDEQNAPYAEAVLTVAAPATLAQLNSIDPRGTLRVILTATRTGVYPTTTTSTRTFDLLLHEREVDHATGTIRLVLRSDEALLIDAGLVATVPNNWIVANWAYSSLRTIINTLVLNPRGTSITAITGQPDASFPALADSDYNLATSARADATWNASADLNVTNVSTVKQFYGRPARRGTRKAGTGSSGVALYPHQGNPIAGLIAGGDYRAAIKVLAFGSPRTDVKFRVHAAGTGAVIDESEAFRVGTASAKIIELDFTLPAGVTSIWFAVGWSGGAEGQGAQVGDLILHDLTGAEPRPFPGYFDQFTGDNDEYTYQWDTTVGRAWRFATYNAYTWEPGQAAWDFVAPLVEASALRLFCDEQRVWRLVDPVTYAVPTTLAVTATTNLTAASEGISRDADWYDSVVVKYVSTRPNGTTRTEYDVSGPASGTKTLLHQWPGRRKPKPGAGNAILTRATNRGVTLDVEALSDYTATPAKSVSVTLPDGTTRMGIISRVTWRFAAEGDGHGTMTLGTRGVTL